MTDLDPLLHEAMSRVRGPVDARPSLIDVRRRARRHNRRRMTATVGVVACTGVATAALIIRRDSAGTAGVASAPVDSVADGDSTSTVFVQQGGPTTTVFGSASLTITASAVWDALWNARYDPSGGGLVVEPADQAAAEVMPTPEQFGCTTQECRAMYNYVIWHELALQLGFASVPHMQDMNSGIDFSQPPREGDVLQSVFSSFSTPPTMDPNNETPTTISVYEGVVLIDAGAPAGAMEACLPAVAGLQPHDRAGLRQDRRADHGDAGRRQHGPGDRRRRRVRHRWTRHLGSVLHRNPDRRDGRSGDRPRLLRSRRRCRWNCGHDGNDIDIARLIHCR